MIFHRIFLNLKFVQSLKTIKITYNKFYFETILFVFIYKIILQKIKKGTISKFNIKVFIIFNILL